MPSNACQSALGSALALCVAAPAYAQSSGDNALRAAEDAFGVSVGNESIGLYSPYGVRGFSPFSAGNLRVEGIYADMVVGLNSRVIRGSTVRVGISAQGYPFPAPTGIADYRLRLPGKDAVVNTSATIDSFGTKSLQVDGQLPIVGETLGIAAGFHKSRDYYHFNGGGQHHSGAMVLRWRPAAGVEIAPFFSSFTHEWMDNHPIFVPQSPVLPDEIARGRSPNQDWAHYHGTDRNGGVVARWRGDDVEVAGGLFRSTTTIDESYSEQFSGIIGRAAAQDIVSAAPEQQYGSTSGELRGSYSLREGARRHVFMADVRGRDRKRRYGGGATIDLGPVDIERPLRRPKPEFEFGPQTRDHVQQWTFGLGYQAQWANVGELTLGIQKTNYRKELLRPDGVDPPTKAEPLLVNAALAVTPTRRLAIYAGYTRGLEESPVAPTFALNRDEAPPAIQTMQYDAGVRWALNDKTKLVVGVFNIEKPYFGLDNERIFRQLGQRRHRGIELSIAGALTDRLNLLAGAILLDATVNGDEVERGAVGRRPVGAVPRTLLVSLEYRLVWLEGLSVDASATSTGKIAANSVNSLFVKPSTTFDVGARFSTNVSGKPLSLRLAVSNLLDDYCWDVLGSNALFYSSGRQISLRLSSDL